MRLFSLSYLLSRSHQLSFLVNLGNRASFGNLLVQCQYIIVHHLDANRRILNGNNDFNYIRDVYEVCINKYRQYPFKSSSDNRGKKILTSEQEVDTYISFYGARHYYKLIEAFNALNLNRFSNTYIETISYGCGAATDTCCLISYCHTKNISLSINKITLIEPSTIALRRGVQYIKQSLPNQVINQLNI